MLWLDSSTAARARAVLLLAIVGATGTSAQERPRTAVATLEAALDGAETALRDGEPQIAESRFRSALLEGWLLLGSLAIEDERLADARRAFERAATTTIETRRALSSLALVELELGETETALERLRSLVLENPTNHEARRLLARALTASGRHDEAVLELEQLHAVAPEELEHAFLLATAYLRDDRPEAAEPLFAELAETRPLPQTWVLIGRVLRDFDHHQEARAALQRAIAIDPTVRRAHYYLGTIELRDEGRSRLDEAMAEFEAELRVTPEDPMASLYLGIALVERRRHEEAIPKLEIASRLAGAERDALQFLGRSYLALGRADEAVPALARALELAEAQAAENREANAEFTQSQIASLHYQLALALRRSGDEESAAGHFEASKRYSANVAESSREILSRYLDNETEVPDTDARSLLGGSALAALSGAQRAELEGQVSRAVAQCYLNLGVLQLRVQQHARAADLFEQAVELEPDFPQGQYSLGVARFNAGQHAQATEPLGRALEERPTDGDLRRMLALAWLNAEGYARAAELLGDDPERANNGSLQYAYGLALVRSGRAEEAEAVFAELLDGNADWPELNVVVGQAHAKQDDYETAIGYLERAIELDPTVAEAHSTLGDIYLRLGRLDEAESALRTELDGHPDDHRALYTLAVVLDLNRKSQQALDVLAPLLARRPRMADARYLRGKILLAGGEAESALAELSLAAEIAPEDANVRYQLGRALQTLGRADDAEAEFETFRRLKDTARSGDAP